MAIIAKETGGTDFTPAPAGVHQGVCCDVVDMGVVEVTYAGTTKTQQKVRIVWEIDETMDDGRRFIVQRRYTLSLNEKASLRKDLESWRGRAFTPEELKGFDLEKLLGVNAMLNVMRAEREGKQYANVMAVMPLHKGMSKLTPSTDYVRVKDRPEQKSTGATAPVSTGTNEDNWPIDDDVPF